MQPRACRAAAQHRAGPAAAPGPWLLPATLPTSHGRTSLSWGLPGGRAHGSGMWPVGGAPCWHRVLLGGGQAAPPDSCPACLPPTTPSATPQDGGDDSGLHQQLREDATIPVPIWGGGAQKGPGSSSWVSRDPWPRTEPHTPTGALGPDRLLSGKTHTKPTSGSWGGGGSPAGGRDK